MSLAFDVSVIHSDGDLDLAEQLAKRLQDKYSLTVWFKKWQLIPGQPRQQGLAKGLSVARTCVVCLGATLDSWTRQQLGLALERQSREPEFRVIPVFLPNANRAIQNDFLDLQTPVDLTRGLEDSSALHILVSGIKGVPPGRGHDDENIPDEILASTRKNLQRIKQLHSEQLIEKDLELEYKRRILDDMIGSRGD